MTTQEIYAITPNQNGWRKTSMIIKITLEQLRKLEQSGKVELTLDQVGNESSTDGIGGIGSYALVLSKLQKVNEQE